jgi:hypothetical protein
MLHKTSAALSAVAVGLLLHLSGAAAETTNLRPSYQPRPQTDAERLQTFKPPAPPAGPTYPSIQGGDRGDPRLYVNPNVSFGGSINAGGGEVNVRVPNPLSRP